MINNRTIYDVEEEKIMFINTFLIEQCQKIDPHLNLATLPESGKLMGVQLQDEQYQYFYNKKIPLLFVDLKLLIDGV